MCGTGESPEPSYTTDHEGRRPARPVPNSSRSGTGAVRLQRTRPPGIVLRRAPTPRAPRPDEQASGQLYLTGGDSEPLVIEAAADRARAHYGRKQNLAQTSVAIPFRRAEPV
jgi:hypothetical protein